MDAMLHDYRLEAPISIYPPPLPDPVHAIAHATADTLPIDPDTGIPKPGVAPVVADRKSHAKKKPDGHIKRPPNSWILFRSDYVYAQKVRC